MSSLADKADEYPQPIKGHISHKEWEKHPNKVTMDLDYYKHLKAVVDRADPIKPNYYRRTIKGVEIDAIDIIQAFGLGFCLGNALKYILRAGQKSDNSKEQDLKKAGENIQREIGHD